MRADRLLSLVMLLQTRGNMRHALGEELEVSERTIYRDVDGTRVSPGSRCTLSVDRGAGSRCWTATAPA